MTSQTERKPGICHSCGVKVAMIPGIQNDLCGACAHALAGGTISNHNAVDRRWRKPARGRWK